MASFSTWPAAAQGNVKPSAEAWLTQMATSDCYMDGAFLLVAADLFNVNISHICWAAGGILSKASGVSCPLGRPFDSPGPQLLELELAYLKGHHFVAIAATTVAQEDPAFRRIYTYIDIPGPSLARTRRDTCHV